MGAAFAAAAAHAPIPLLHTAPPSSRAAPQQHVVPKRVAGAPRLRGSPQRRDQWRENSRLAVARLAGWSRALWSQPRRSLPSATSMAADFGPWPAPEPLSSDELYAAEFTRDFERDGDPRAAGYFDDVRDCADEGDWQGCITAIENMWKNSIDPDAWTYNIAIEACMKANETESVAAGTKLRNEMLLWGPYPDAKRFQLTPNVKWQREMKQAGCNCHNTLDWKGRDPVPTTNHPVWLLPAQDDAAEHIAEYQTELRQAGWKILSCSPELVATLRSKAALHEMADELNLTATMPARYYCPGDASYPCILKPSRGTWGKNTNIVYSSEEVLRLMRPGKIYEVERQIEQQSEYLSGYSDQWGGEDDTSEDGINEGKWAEQAEKIEQAVMDWINEAEWEEIGSDWVLTELAVGRYEYSTTLLVDDGMILDYAASRYNFSSDVYVWPALEYDSADYASVPADHLDIFRKFLTNFSGICNFNYKLRPNGEMCIFEINPRVGGDLVFDVPKRRVKAMLEKLDAMLS